MFICPDPDPYSEYGSGSTKVVNTDPIWIRIHNIVLIKTLSLADGGRLVDLLRLSKYWAVAAVRAACRVAVYTLWAAVVEVATTSGAASCHVALQCSRHTAAILLYSKTCSKCQPKLSFCVNNKPFKFNDQDWWKDENCKTVIRLNLMFCKDYVGYDTIRLVNIRHGCDFIVMFYSLLLMCRICDCGSLL